MLYTGVQIVFIIETIQRYRLLMNVKHFIPNIYSNSKSIDFFS